MAYETWFKIEGIDGAVLDGARRGWSAVTSFSQSVQAGHGNGQPFQFSNLSRKMDRSSPLFARAAAEGRHFREALIELVSAEGTMRIRLQDVTLQSYSFNSGSSDTESMPMENVGLEAQKAEWAFTPAGGREVKASWPPEGAARKPAEPAAV